MEAYGSSWKLTDDEVDGGVLVHDHVNGEGVSDLVASVGREVQRRWKESEGGGRRWMLLTW